MDFFWTAVRLRSHPNECKGEYKLKCGCAAVLRPFTKLLRTLVFICYNYFIVVSKQDISIVLLVLYMYIDSSPTGSRMACVNDKSQFYPTRLSTSEMSHADGPKHLAGTHYSLIAEGRVLSCYIPRCFPARSFMG